ncbi:class I SAM-dependent RNA methyltransferase [Candidatus Saccharibacteria bacterium]|nr:class I SAM-dependent RNA methyltransferase [Candidatus Saccharibacteria bacterium]
MKTPTIHEVTIEKLVHGGQGLGVLPDGRKVFVWNALPGEKLTVQVTKSRKDYAEGIAIDVLDASDERIEPVDEAYMSTSPWQIMNFAAENTHKASILEETFAREKLTMPKLTFESAGSELHYRNKMEYSFWADDDGLHLALFNRGTHGKRIVTGSSIARPEVDETAVNICKALNDAKIRGSQLKTVIVRCNQAGETVAALYVKDKAFPKIAALEALAKGVGVCYSTPKSPASVLTKKLYQYGDVSLQDEVLSTAIRYDVNSFFQVNLPVFDMAVKRIKQLTDGAKQKIDMYSGVGTIGIPIGDTFALVELDPHNVVMAKQNVGDLSIEVVQASSEQALEYVTSDATIIVDPPRAGLHAKLIDKLLAQKPKLLVYLSCNPVTQARDIAALQDTYEVTEFAGYNFFPRTPHIESLVALQLKGDRGK